MKQITRRYDIDWLRTIGVLLLIDSTCHCFLFLQECLFIFSIVGLPLFSRISKGYFKNFLFNLTSFLEKPLILMLTIIPITIASAVDILGDKNPMVYFLIFLIGYLLGTDERYQKAINRDKWIYTILSFILIYLKFILPDDFELWTVMWVIYGLFDRA